MLSMDFYPIFGISKCYGRLCQPICLLSDKLLRLPRLNITLPKRVSSQPISQVITVFIDGSGKTTESPLLDFTNIGIISKRQTSTRGTELKAAIMHLRKFPRESINIVTDSQYVVYVTQNTEQATIRELKDSSLVSLFLILQALLDK